MNEGNFLTTNQGVIIVDDMNSLKFGDRGPIIIEDHHFREKITHFDHERIPERVVHARGSGAHGNFVSYDNWSFLTKAKFLSEKDKTTPVFVRFSQTLGSKGSSDMVRDVRGFAVKFYTEEGNYDFVGNNIPVFFIQDPVMFPDVIHSGKPEPHTEFPQATAAHDNFWDFVSLTPETSHMLMWVMSPIAVPSSYRKMNGSGVNTFKFVNDLDETKLIKLHFISSQGLESLEWKTVQKISGIDPDNLRRDLWESIEKGEYPEWEFAVQIMDPETEMDHDFDPLDPTKIWPVSQFPMIKLGKLTLNKNPDNFFCEVEQVAFHPGHIVPGIDLSDDPILQGRLFSYLDTQLSRIGVNFSELPINRPIVNVNNNQQDGKLRHRINRSITNYHPNTRSGGCPFAAIDVNSNKGLSTFSRLSCGFKTLKRPDKFNEHFRQATDRWNNLKEWEKEHVVDAFSYELGGVAETQIIINVLKNIIYNISTELEERVRRKIVKRFNEDGTRVNIDKTGRLSKITYHQI